MIGVLGSSGHVGSLLADMLKAKGYELRLGSRSAGFIVNMTDPSSLSRFLDGCDAVVNCAGPAYLLSEPAARTAISSGVAYFDVAGCENLCKTLADESAETPVVFSAGMVPGLSGLLLTVSYTHLRAHETGRNLVCRLLLEKKKKQTIKTTKRYWIQDRFQERKKRTL